MQLDYVWFASEYKGQMRDILWDFKYHRQRALGSPLAHLLSSVIHVRSCDVVTWVPTSPHRRRQRGYDHAELLARSVGRELQLPVSSSLTRKGKARQVGMSRQKRWEQAKAQYVPKKANEIADQRILLVDDIVTSGATLSSCAKLLKAAGARSVSAAVVAKD